MPKGLLKLLLPALLLAGCTEMNGASARYHFEYEPKIPVTIPAHAPSISQQFRRGVSDAEDHPALDVIAPEGTPVLSVADGIVTRVWTGPAYGKRIEIDHGKDENGLDVTTRYYHLHSQIVTEGEKVQRGQQIGTLGHSGVLAALTNHLHYSIKLSGPGRLPTLVDPNLYWISGVGIVECFDPKKTYPDTPFRTTYPVTCD